MLAQVLKGKQQNSLALQSKKKKKLRKVTPEGILGSEDETPLEAPKEAKPGLSKARSALQKLSIARSFRELGEERAGRNTLLQQLISNPNLTDDAEQSKPNNKIHPGRGWKVTWDLVLALFIIYSTVTVPLRLSLDLAPSTFEAILDVLVDIYFGVDIFLSFRTGFEDPNGMMVWDSKKIARNYMTGWFTIDVLSTFPFDTVGKLFFSGINPAMLRSTKLLRALRLFRLLKLARMVRLTGFLGKHEKTAQVNHTLIAIIKMIVQVTFVGHLMACAWYAVGEYSVSSDRTSWLEEEGILGSSSAKKYFVSIYWAFVTMSTVGYGDINAVTGAERLFSIFSMIIGASMFGYVVGNITVLFESLDASRSLTREKMDSVIEYMRSRKLPKELSLRIKSHFDHFYSHKSVFEEQDILDSLPPNLSATVVMGFAKDMIDRMDFFHTVDRHGTRQRKDAVLVTAMVLAMKPFRGEPGELIFRDGDLSTQFYMVQTGRIELKKGVRLKLDDKERTHLLYKKIGEGGMFGEEAVCGSMPRVYSALATQGSDMWFIDRDEYQSWQFAWPGLAHEMRKRSIASSNELTEWLAQHTSDTVGKELHDKIKEEEEDNSEADFSDASFAGLLEDAVPRETEDRGSEVERSDSAFERSTEGADDDSAFERSSEAVAGGDSSFERSSEAVAVGDVADGDSRSAETVADSSKSADTDGEHTEPPNDDKRGSLPRLQPIVHAPEPKKRPAPPKRQLSAMDLARIHQHRGSTGKVTELQKNVLESVMRAKLRKKVIFHPESGYRLAWDFLLLLVIVYSTITVPLRLAFDMEFTGFLFATDTIADVFFVLDMFVNFRTAYFYRSKLVHSPKKIAKHYLLGWFTIDFFSTVPFDRIVDPFTSGGDSATLRATKLLRVFKITKLLKLLRVAKLSKFFGKYERTIEINPAVIRMVKLTVIMVFVAHLNGCLWHYVGYDTEIVTWMHTYCIAGRDNVIKCAIDESMGSRYLTSIYWAFTTMITVGFGDVIPYIHHQEEMATVLASLMIGVTVFAHVISGVMNLVFNFDPAQRLYKQNLASLQDYMRSRNLPVELRHHVRSHYTHHLAFKSVFPEEQILGELPTFLRRPVVLFVFRNSVGKHSVLKQIDSRFPGFIAEIATSMKAILIRQGEYVCRAGQVSRQMYFVQHGKVDIENPQGEVTKSLKEGDYFGETALFTPDSVAFQLGISAKAASETTLLLSLNRTDVFTMKMICPALVTMMQKVLEDNRRGAAWGQLTGGEDESSSEEEDVVAQLQQGMAASMGSTDPDEDSAVQRRQQKERKRQQRRTTRSRNVRVGKFGVHNRSSGGGGKFGGRKK